MGKKQVLAVLSLFVFFCVFALTNAQKWKRVLHYFLRVSWIRKQGRPGNEDRHCCMICAGVPILTLNLFPAYHQWPADPTIQIS